MKKKTHKSSRNQNVLGVRAELGNKKIEKWQSSMAPQDPSFSYLRTELRNIAESICLPFLSDPGKYLSAPVKIRKQVGR